MDVPLVISHRLKELGLEQKDLAGAAQVTESYISQLLARKKDPPAPGRTDIYDKIGKFLRLPEGELPKLAELQRQEELKKKAAEPSIPLFKECRDLILRKNAPGQRTEIRRIFEKEPFGELERLVTQKLLDVSKRLAKEELDNESWLRHSAANHDRSYEQMRVSILEFLDTAVFNISIENCIAFLDPFIESWNIDLQTFAIEIVLHNPIAGKPVPTRFEFTEVTSDPFPAIEPGLAAFLKDKSLNSNATADEIEFLQSLKFKTRRPAPLYYYRELQNLRDPLHFQ